MDKIIIPFGDEGLEDVSSGLLELAQILEDIQSLLPKESKAFQESAKSIRDNTRALREYTRAAKDAAGATSQLNGSQKSNQAFLAGAPTAAARARQVSGTANLPPQVRAVQRADDQLAAAIGSGDPIAIAIARQNKLKAQNSAIKAAQPLTPPVDPSMRGLMSSRLAIGPNGQPQLMPLVSQIGSMMPGQLGAILNMSGRAGNAAATAAGAAGIEEAAALAPPVAAAAAAFAALVTVVKLVVDRMHDFATLQSAGGTLGESARLRTMGQQLGINAGNSAWSFGENLAGGGPAATFWRRFGVQPFASQYGAGGDQDFTRKFTTGITKFLNMNDQDAHRAARLSPELREIYWARYLTKDSKDDLIKQIGHQTTPEELTSSAETQLKFNTGLARTKDLLADIGGTVLPAVNGILETLNRNLKAIQAAFDWVNKTIRETPQGMTTPSGAMKPTPAVDPQKARENMSRDRNTEAINKNTEAINGIYGGGERSRRAIPGQWTGAQVDQQAIHAARLEGSWIL